MRGSICREAYTVILRLCNTRLRRGETLASGNHKFQSGLLDLLAVHMDSSHATGSVCSCTKWLYAREVMMARGSGCGTSLSTQVARAFCSLCTEWNVCTHTHTHTHTHTCTLLGGVLFLLWVSFPHRSPTSIDLSLYKLWHICPTFFHFMCIVLNYLTLFILYLLSLPEKEN